MSLTKNKEGNFYPISIPEVGWRCDYLWSSHRGCRHACNYCSSNRWNNHYHPEIDPAIERRLKGEWKDDYISTRLPINSAIFASPYNDIMTIEDADIRQILDICNQIKSSSYIFQTKDPAKYFDYIDLIPEGSWLGTTIETANYDYNSMNISKAPDPFNRRNWMQWLGQYPRFKKFITIEPIMEFDLNLVKWMKDLQPNLIFIGANTSKAHLPESTNDELVEFIYALYDTIGVEKVYLKSNVRRLIPAFYDGWKLAEKQNEVAGANNEIAF